MQFIESFLPLVYDFQFSVLVSVKYTNENSEYISKQCSLANKWR